MLLSPAIFSFARNIFAPLPGGGARARLYVHSHSNSIVPYFDASVVAAFVPVPLTWVSDSRIKYNSLS